MKHLSEKANEIVEVLMAYAELDFSAKISLVGDGGLSDAIASGINMLGEELENNVISLQEKEQLLKEIHHRVKNNMQIISSLINLQFAGEKDERVLKLVKESQGRIAAMALVHEILYATANFKKIRFSNYIGLLAESLFRSYAPNNHQIDLEIEVDKSIMFEMEKIVPLGLIINEVITNSLKYAFPNNKGKVSIIMLPCDDNNCELNISDNGIGLPGNFTKENVNLGMQLIEILAQQIDAEVGRVNNNGLSYQITLKN